MLLACADCAPTALKQKPAAKANTTMKTPTPRNPHSTRRSSAIRIALLCFFIVTRFIPNSQTRASSAVPKSDSFLLEQHSHLLSFESFGAWLQSYLFFMFTHCDTHHWPYACRHRALNKPHNSSITPCKSLKSTFPQPIKNGTAKIPLRRPVYFSNVLCISLLAWDHPNSAD